MDYNSPIYREKYLKYKKKYMELKENQTAGFGLFKKGKEYMKKRDEANKIANENKKIRTDVMNKFKEQLTEVDNSEKIKEVREKLSKSQSDEVLKAFHDLTHSGTFKSGTIPTAINKIPDVYELKETKDGDKVNYEKIVVSGQDDKLSTEERLNNIYKETIDGITLAKKTEELIEAGIKTLHDKLSSELDVKSKEVFANATIENIQKMNEQIASNKNCKGKLEQTYNACTPEKLDALKKSQAELKQVEKDMTDYNNKKYQPAESSLRSAFDVISKLNDPEYETKEDISEVTLKQIKGLEQKVHDSKIGAIGEKFNLPKAIVEDNGKKTLTDASLKQAIEEAEREYKIPTPE